MQMSHPLAVRMTHLIDVKARWRWVKSRRRDSIYDIACILLNERRSEPIAAASSPFQNDKFEEASD